ncbi:MAG: ABC transporter substrate-binding protein [Clostridia bacterium]|nr:ABC transporter substrate-binding protein [Clostridia bacterium]
MKRIISFLAVLSVLAFSLLSLASCGRGKGVTVRYLNFKPEVAGKYEAIAKEYERETGVRLVIDTAAANTYEQTLLSRLPTSDAPTIFQINGPRSFSSFKDYLSDLKGTELYKHLSDPSLALEKDGKVYGVPYVVEGYGIIYNKKLMERYFSFAEKQTPYKSVDEIKSFDALSAVVRDMQKNKAALGIDGVFAATSLKSGEDWRWQTHLFNLPLSYELDEKKVDETASDYKDFEFLHSESFKRLFDLYIENSTTPKNTLGTKTVADSMAEFALEKCAMVQNGSWAYAQIASEAGNKVKAEDVGFLPLYMGGPGEETQGICIGTENYYAINAKASAEEKKAAEDFLWWLYSSERGKQFVREELGFIAPFDTFAEGDVPNDPLAKEVLRFMQSDTHENVPWRFSVIPSLRWKEDFGAALLSYAQGKKSFASVVSDLKAGWKNESM